jgi:hypothetical protein
MEDGRYYVGRLARAVTKSKRARTFYASSVVVGEIEGYVESARARVVRRAQTLDRYDDLPTRLVTHETGRRRRVLHWRDRDGVIGQTPLAEATEEERMSFVTEGQDGPQPLWLWLNESGLPFRPGFVGCVFRAADERCEAVLSPVMSEPPLPRHGVTRMFGQGQFRHSRPHLGRLRRALHRPVDPPPSRNPQKGNNANPAHRAGFHGRPAPRLAGRLARR